MRPVKGPKKDIDRIKYKFEISFSMLFHPFDYYSFAGTYGINSGAA